MNFLRMARICLLVAGVAASVPAFARIPIRQSSDNGASSGVDSWTLLGRSIPITLSAGGKVVTMTRQILCPNQDRLNGGCSSGTYMFLYQLQSSSTNVPINIGKLVGFTANSQDDTGTYGVMICDDGINDLQLCTEDPNDPQFTKLPATTFKVNGKKATSVVFTISSFPSFPAGSQPEEGQGLTLYIVTQQSPTAPLPLPYPSIGD
jgi:hypothetical protein